MLVLRHCRLSSEDLITCERALLRFTAGRAKKVDFDFNVWDYSVPEIYGYILGMFEVLDLVDCLGINSGELLDFIIDVDQGYQATFYHSFYHAADVTVVLYHMLEGMCASQYLSKPDMAALLLAGLCHDIGHPGLNNLFQINAKTELVKQHGEASVLEKYSCSLAMDLVTKHSLFRNIAQSPSALLPEGQPATDACMRDAMIKAILATDMTFHYDMLNNLNNLIEATITSDSSSASDDTSDSDCDSYEQGADSLDASSTVTPPTTQSKESTEKDNTPAASPRPKKVSMATPISASKELPRLGTTMDATQKHSRKISGDWDSSQSSTDSDSVSSSRCMEANTLTAADFTPEQRQNLCNCLLHAADISNAVKPWTVCKRWSDLVVQEFFRQGDIEKAQGLPVSPSMDRDVNDQPQISLGFGDFVVQPYFGALADLLPAATSVMDTLANNREQWLALQETSRQFRNDPYLSVDPLEEPSMSRRPSSPGLHHLASGRRVSVAAGVLVLDDAMLFRAPYRRTRHSTNTEATALRRMKRSLSGRSLSTSMQNLHAHSQRASQSSGKTGLGHEILISTLKRQASLTERDMSSSSYMAQYSQVGNFVTDSTASKSAQLPPATQPRPSTPQAPEPPVTKPVEQGKQRSSTISSGGGGSFRQKRLASLQVASQVPESIRKEYGDGYPALKDQSAVSTGYIPSSATDNTSALAAPAAPPHGQSAPPSAHAGNRSSTPAVMMSKIKYDWPLSPTLPEIPTTPRFGLGPLDGAEASGPPTDSLALAGGSNTIRPSLSATVVRMSEVSKAGARVLPVTSGLISGSSSAPAVPTIGGAKIDDVLPSADKRAAASKSIKSADGAVQITTAGGSQKRA